MRAAALAMGAVLALHLAAQRQDQVHGLALYAPTLWYDGWAMPWYRDEPFTDSSIAWMWRRS